MAAQIISEIIRTGEGGGTYRNAYFTTYFGTAAFIQGVSNTVTISDRRELENYFRSVGITEVRFERRKNHRQRYARYHIKRGTACQE